MKRARTEENTQASHEKAASLFRSEASSVAACALDCSSIRISAACIHEACGMWRGPVPVRPRLHAVDCKHRGSTVYECTAAVNCGVRWAIQPGNISAAHTGDTWEPVSRDTADSYFSVCLGCIGSFERASCRYSAHVAAVGPHGTGKCDEVPRQTAVRPSKQSYACHVQENTAANRCMAGTTRVLVKGSVVQ